MVVVTSGKKYIDIECLCRLKDKRMDNNLITMQPEEIIFKIYDAVLRCFSNSPHIVRRIELVTL